MTFERKIPKLTNEELFASAWRAVAAHQRRMRREAADAENAAAERAL